MLAEKGLQPARRRQGMLTQFLVEFCWRTVAMSTRKGWLYNSNTNRKEYLVRLEGR